MRKLWGMAGSRGDVSGGQAMKHKAVASVTRYNRAEGPYGIESTQRPPDHAVPEVALARLRFTGDLRADKQHAAPTPFLSSTYELTALLLVTGYTDSRYVPQDWACRGAHFRQDALHGLCRSCGLALQQRRPNAQRAPLRRVTQGLQAEPK
jgi:hypothetical protein